jgi:Flp pilus assembly protein TadD
MNHTERSTKPDRAALARALCDRGRWPEVLEFAQKWSAENAAEAKAFFYQGIAFAAMGRLAEAETAYRRSLALDEKSSKAWNNLATLLFGPMNRPVEGAKCLAQALKVDPSNHLGWANLASMNGQLGRHVEARVCAERVGTRTADGRGASAPRARRANAWPDGNRPGRHCGVGESAAGEI